MDSTTRRPTLTIAASAGAMLLVGMATLALYLTTRSEPQYAEGTSPAVVASNFCIALQHADAEALKRFVVNPSNVDELIRELRPLLCHPWHDSDEAKYHVPHVGEMIMIKEGKPVPVLSRFFSADRSLVVQDYSTPKQRMPVFIIPMKKHNSRWRVADGFILQTASPHM